MVVLLAAVGCGGSAVEEETIASAQLSYDQAADAFGAGNYTQARTSLDQALENSAGLNPDVYVDALLKRSICLSAAGEFEAAAADISEAERGATDLAQVHIARGIMFSKQGDDAKAKQEFADAKKLDPKAGIPKV